MQHFFSLFKLVFGHFTAYLPSSAALIRRQLIPRADLNAGDAAMATNAFTGIEMCCIYYKYISIIIKISISP